MKEILAAILMFLTGAPADLPVEVAKIAPADLCQVCTVSDEGLALIKQFEGFRPYPYKDVAGLDTIGFGHLIKPGEKIPVPLLGQAAHELLVRDTEEAQTGVNRYTSIPLKQGQFDALVSFTFNLGVGAYKGSSVRDRVNRELHIDVPGRMLLWNKARVDGKLKPVPGLTRRRIAEGTLYDMATKDSVVADYLY